MNEKLEEILIKIAKKYDMSAKFKYDIDNKISSTLILNPKENLTEKEKDFIYRDVIKKLDKINYKIDIILFKD